MACVYVVGVLLLLRASGEKLAICGGDGHPAANQRAAWDYIHRFYSAMICTLERYVITY
jgi:hypothetical protein